MNDSTSNIGTWLSIGSPAIAELAALSGFGRVLIDLEHGSGTEATPADLQHALKTHADAAPSYAECLKSVVAAAKDAGKSAGILVRDLSDLPTHRELGFSHIAVDSDLGILRKAYQQMNVGGTS